MRVRWLLLLLAAAGAAEAQDLCGTGGAAVERARAVHEWTSRRSAKAASAPIGTIRNGVLIVPADDVNAPFRHPFDLAGRALRLSRKDSTTFTIADDAAGFDDAVGDLRSVPQGGSIGIALPFSMPFFGARLNHVEVSAYNGIFAAAPDAVQFDQYGPLEIAAQPVPVIAPLLTTRSVIGQNGAAVRVRSARDKVVVTWSLSLSSPAIDYQVQAQLFPNGDIVFAYPRVIGVSSGALVVSPGRDALRAGATTIASASDAAGDAVAPAALAGGVDIVSASISESDALGMLEIRIDLADAPSVAGLGANDYVRYDVLLGDPAARVSLWLFGDGSEQFAAPVWGATLRNVAARVEGNSVVFDVLQEYLDRPTGQDLACTFQTVVSARGITVADTLTTTARLRAARRPVLTPIRSLAAGSELTGLAADAFTLPIFDPFGAWDEIKRGYNLTETSYDAVAFYQNFTTDIVYYAGAYSTVGNPGVDGIWKFRGIGTDFPIDASLLHMNRIGFAKNTDAKSAGRVLMHEFGHRWLYAFEILENGASTRALSPTSAHPAQFVDTRAAFPVYDAADASVMGGGFFTDLGGSAFRSGRYGAYGYSWLDLYMMGLAAPEEVQPSFYLAGTPLPVGAGNFPPEEQIFHGLRHDVVIDQVVGAMGPRRPAYPDTQRHFRVLFVVVEDPQQPATDAELAQLDIYRATFAEKFRIATGGRADVAVSWQVATPPGPRHRAVRP